MNASADLLYPAEHAPALPFYRERPRVDLASGNLVGQTIALSCAVPPAASLDLACQLSAAQAIPVSVRVTAPLVDLPRLVAASLDRNAISPDQLEVAVSGAVLERTAGQTVIDSLLALSALCDQGVDIALYDFGDPGTLDLVDDLPLSAVILKPSLLIGLPGSAAATSRLHGLLGMATRSGLRVVATGIEAEAQRALLSGLGCHHGEGSLFGEPC